jgi:hypothetical protein
MSGTFGSRLRTLRDCGNDITIAQTDVAPVIDGTLDAAWVRYYLLQLSLPLRLLQRHI